MKTIPVFRRGEVWGEAIVDDADFDRLAIFRWAPDKDGYVRRSQRVAGRTQNFSLHREVLSLSPGEGRVDHRNGNRLDNRRANLRVVSHQANMHNRGRMSGSGTSRHRGVTWHAAAGKWQATVMLDGVSHYLGLYEDEEEAGRVTHGFRVEHMPNYEGGDL